MTNYRADVCNYQITVPENTYQSGKIHLKIEQADDGNRVYINKGKSLKESQGDNTPIKAGTTLTVDVSDSFFITSIPIRDRLNTGFKFSYYVEGESTNEAAFEIGITLIAIIAGAVLLIIILCICMCCRRGNDKVAQDVPTKGAELTASGYMQ